MAELTIAERIEQAKKKAQNLKVDIEVIILGVGRHAIKATK